MGRGAGGERCCAACASASFGEVCETDRSLLSDTQSACCYAKSGVCVTRSLTVGEIYSLNFIVLLRFRPAFVVAGRCRSIALKSEELAPPPPSERIRAVDACLLPAPTAERKMSGKVFVRNSCQDVFGLAFCARYCLALSAFQLHPDGKAESVRYLRK